MGAPAERSAVAERGVVRRALRVDWPQCQARGVCAELLPELVELDEWGYPIVGGELTEDLVALAKQAVRMCPRLALRIVPARDR
jgi:ferredoxin